MNANRLFINLCLAVALLLGCKSDIDGQLSMALNERVKLANGPTFGINDLSNSICPQGAVCITGGAATAAIAIDSQRDTLCVGPDCGRPYLRKQRSRTFTVGTRSVTIELLSVDRAAPGEQRPKRAIFRID